jgi:Uncharacterized protein conserved in bacteria
VFLFTKPGRQTIRRFLEMQQNAEFSYSDIGATRGCVPEGYNTDHNRIKIGTGRADFEAATNAVRNWRMFDMPWVNLCWPDTPIDEGQTVAILVRHFGFWSLNAARIVYVIGEKGDIEKFGFAYGTLPEHSEKGEERFSVEFHHASGEVWYDLLAFSRTNHFLARLGYPLSRMLQHRFAADSKQAILKAVRDGPEFD